MSTVAHEKKKRFAAKYQGGPLKVNRVRDFLERVGWTTIQVVGGALLAYLETGDPWSWRTAANAVGLAVLKVLVAQNVGRRGSGDAIPGGVIEKGGKQP